MTYYKELYVFDQQRPVNVTIRAYAESDFDALIRLQEASFPPPYPAELLWNKEQLANHVTLFPQGALCVEVEGKLTASMTGLLVRFNPAHPHHTWEEMTDGGYIRNHDPSGETLYVADICVDPAYRKLGLGKWMMQSMYEVVVSLRLRRLLGCGRLSGYHRHAGEMSAELYIEAVLRGDLRDPVITFLLRCGRTPMGLVPGYLEDEESHNYGMLMEWRNPFVSA